MVNVMMAALVGLAVLCFLGATAGRPTGYAVGWLGMVFLTLAACVRFWPGGG